MAGSNTGTRIGRGSSGWQHQMHGGTFAHTGCGPRREVAARAELMFDYCDVTDNDPVRLNTLHGTMLS